MKKHTYVIVFPGNRPNITTSEGYMHFPFPNLAVLTDDTEGNNCLAAYRDFDSIYSQEEWDALSARA